jgi:hypothetical protein
VVTSIEATRMAEATQPYSSYVPTIANVATSFAVAQWTRSGDRVHVEFQFTLSAAPAGEVTMSLPGAATTALAFGGFAARGVVGGTRGGSGGTPQYGFVYLVNANTVGFVSGSSNWTTGVPVAWAGTDVWGGSFDYQVA